MAEREKRSCSAFLCNRKLRPYYIKTLRAGFFLVLQKMPCYAKA